MFFCSLARLCHVAAVISCGTGPGRLANEKGFKKIENE